MCYAIYLSTDLEDDLSRFNTDLVQFEHFDAPNPILSSLKYINKWYVASKSGCSCTFRHLTSVELGFGAPVDWYDEDQNEIAATLTFIKVIRTLINRGAKVDCIDTWLGTGPSDIQEKSVDLSLLDDDQFRFFENYHFLFV
jgi:hypothetical protein